MMVEPSLELDPKFCVNLGQKLGPSHIHRNSEAEIFFEFGAILAEVPRARKYQRISAPNIGRHMALVVTGVRCLAKLVANNSINVVGGRGSFGALGAKVRVIPVFFEWQYIGDNARPAQRMWPARKRRTVEAKNEVTDPRLCPDPRFADGQSDCRLIIVGGTATICRDDIDPRPHVRGSGSF